jgi:hypothetical protein
LIEPSDELLIAFDWFAGDRLPFYRYAWLAGNHHRALIFNAASDRLERKHCEKEKGQPQGHACMLTQQK